MGLNSNPFLDTLASSENILISGAGGGFDIFCGLPLYFHLKKENKKVYLANLTFTDLRNVECETITPHLAVVNANTQERSGYFPEKFLCQWFEKFENESVDLYCFIRTGVVPLARAYAALIDNLKIDTVILVDGGTDSLMRGDENGLGTPEEDALSLVSVAKQPNVKKFLACLGFGIDAYHGICHAQFLQSVSELSKTGDYYGNITLLKEFEEVRKYMGASEYVFKKMPERASIVNTSIISAIEGEYGNFHKLKRTKNSNSRLWINPLMTLYWNFNLEAVVDRLLYKKYVENTDTMYEIALAIKKFRKSIPEIMAFDSIPV